MFSCSCTLLHFFFLNLMLLMLFVVPDPILADVGELVLDPAVLQLH